MRWGIKTKKTRYWKKKKTGKVSIRNCNQKAKKKKRLKNRPESRGEKAKEVQRLTLGATQG